MLQYEYLSEYEYITWGYIQCVLCPVVAENHKKNTTILIGTTVLLFKTAPYQFPNFHVQLF